MVPMISILATNHSGHVNMASPRNASFWKIIARKTESTAMNTPLKKQTSDAKMYWPGG
jgi:hypothetical protein